MQKDCQKDVLFFLRREVLQTLAEQQCWPAGWAYDGGKNIYTSTAFMPRGEKEYVVEVQEQGCKKPRQMRVAIKWAATVDITELMSFLQCVPTLLFSPTVPAIKNCTCRLVHKRKCSSSERTFVKDRSCVNGTFVLQQLTWLFNQFSCFSTNICAAVMTTKFRG